MKRSVIQLAGRTLLVSLPAKWAAANSILKGDELDLVEDGSRLVVNAKPKATVEEAELDADILGNLIKRSIFALYKKGIDEIKIRYSDPKTGDAIREILMNETVGYEIVSQTQKGCTVKLITSGNITEFDNLLRRTFLLLLSMADETLASIKNKDFEQLSKTALLEEPNNRLTTVCRRSLNKWGSENYNKLGPIYYIVEELENMADEYKYFCNNLVKIKEQANKSVHPDILAVFEKTNEMLRNFYELFYKFDLTKLAAISNSRKRIIAEAHDFIDHPIKKLTAAEYYVIHHSVVIMERIFCVTGPYMVLVN